MTTKFRSGVLHAFFCVFVLFALGGCSTTGSGSGEDGIGGDGSLAEQDLDAQREARYGLGSIPSAESGGIFRDVRFDFDSSTIDDVARQNIEYNFQILQQNPDVKLQLEGHCDERGTADYNLALGSKRAEAVKDVLLSYGVSESRIDTISYGEEVPIDSRNTEEAWAQNRRVHFSAFRGMAK